MNLKRKNQQRLAKNGNAAQFLGQPVGGAGGSHSRDISKAGTLICGTSWQRRVNAVLTFQSHKNVCLRVIFLNLLHLAEVEFGDVRRAEGAQVQIPIMLVDLADVGCNQAVGVVEAPRAHATVVELCNQTVPGNKLHQDILAEELQEGGGKVREKETDRKELKGNQACSVTVMNPA